MARDDEPKDARLHPVPPPLHLGESVTFLEGVRAAAEALRGAKALLVTSGAGMGADSGLPTFRDADGFWRDYPHFRPLRLDFVDVATEAFLKREPHLAWGIHAHLHGRFRGAAPHEGYAILRRWVEELSLDAFSVTSNVDEHFPRSGFPEDRLYEIHGSFGYLQCAAPCGDHVWESPPVPATDVGDCRLRRLPACPRCGAMARPNVLLFDDGGYSFRRGAGQAGRFHDFRRRVERGRLPLVVIELGAGTAIPSIRFLTEEFLPLRHASVFRVNPERGRLPGGRYLRGPALATLEAVDRALRGDGADGASCAGGEEGGGGPPGAPHATEGPS